jgi:SNF2 family DNA or RNA helicase
MLLDPDLSVQWTPKPYQLEAIEFLKDTGCGSLWMDPGTGKTSSCLATLLEYFEFDQRPVLIVAPIRVAHSVWPREIRKWTNFKHLKYTVLHGPDKDWRFNRMADKNIVIINYDGLQWLAKKLKGRMPFSTIIIDESTKVKNAQTQRHKALYEMVGKAQRVWLLTGTPSSNGLMDLFAPQLLVDGGHTFGKWITKFKNEYYTSPAPFLYVLKDGAEERIYDALANCSLRISAKEHLEMPELVFNKVEVDLPPHAREVYNKLEEECIVAFLEGNVTSQNAAVSVMKLQQIANGAVYLDSEAPNDGDVVPTFVRKTQHLHDAKTEATIDIVEELSGKGVIIAFHYKHDYDRLKAAFPDAPAIKSGLKESQLQRIIDEWNAGKHPVLLAHAQSAGHGLNLQEFGCSVIWYSNTYSRELFDQLNARVYRQGQKSPIVVIHQIVAKDTIDEDIIAAQNEKGATQDALFEGVMSRYKELHNK